MRSRSTARNVAQWYWAAAICGGLGLFEATQTVLAMRAAGMHHAWAALFITVLLGWVPWALAAPSVLRLARTYPLFHRTSAGAWVRHVGTWLAISVGAALWNAAIENWLNPYVPDMHSPGFWALWEGKFSNQILSTLVLYGVILLVGWMLESRAKLARQQTEAARLNEQVAKAQLSALRQQIEPHFLFNTLNTIAGLVREGKNDGAVDMIAGLSDLLRRTLQSTDRQQVELREEFEIVTKYLEIEKARFAERLQVQIDVPYELMRVRVPSLILQPIVENAVKHGIAKRIQGGRIAISASRANGTLTLRVANDGPGFAPEWERKGIGLTNVRERLASLYGVAGELVVGNGERGAVVTIAMPDREEVQEINEVEEVKDGVVSEKA
jgi:two-component system, LytTR family, sensor kinase